MHSSEEYRERLNERLTIIHRRDAAPTTTDALLLAAFLPPTEAACELGAGSGLISLLAASRDVIGTCDLVEREEALYGLAVRNIRENGLEGRLTAHLADVREFDSGRHYEAVFANPPYRRAGEGRPAATHLRDVSRFERAGTVADFCQAAAHLLLPTGTFSLVFPTARRDELFRALSDASLYPAEAVTVLPYPEGVPRLFHLRAGRTPAALCERTFTLTVSKTDRRPTEAAEALYRDGVLSI